MLVKVLRMHSLDDAPWTWQSSWNKDMPDFFQGMPSGVYDNIYSDLDDSPVTYHITEVPILVLCCLTVAHTTPFICNGEREYNLKGDAFELIHALFPAKALSEAWPLGDRPIGLTDTTLAFAQSPYMMHLSICAECLPFLSSKILTMFCDRGSP